MGKNEKRFALVLFVIALTLTCLRLNKYYQDHTQPAPKIGGNYIEAMVGEVKYINPILATTDAEKSVSELIFSSLVKFDKDGNVSMDAAISFETDANKLDYIFTLRNDIYFHDGEVLTADDIAYTISLIQDPGMKSPLYEAWKDVIVTVEGDDKIVFNIPKPYGPFIYNCDFKIMPDHVSSGDFMKKFTGSGPYKYQSSKEIDNKITEVKLVRNDRYYLPGPYIKSVSFNFFPDAESALKEFKNGKIEAISGAKLEAPDIVNYSITTCKQLALIPNLRSERFKDKDFRSKVLGDFVFSDLTRIYVKALDSNQQRKKGEEISDAFLKRNIELDITYLSPVEMKDVIDKKDFELLLYGFDYTHDRDPYPFWHSSQLDNKNFAGYSDKSSDILLEDARMITDSKERNAKYDQFYTTLSNEKLILFFDPVVFEYQIKNTIFDVSQNNECEASARFYSINLWYMSEKRVKK